MCVSTANNIGVEGAKALAVSLPHLVNLTTLKLGGNQTMDALNELRDKQLKKS